MTLRETSESYVRQGEGQRHVRPAGMVAGQLGLEMTAEPRKGDLSFPAHQWKEGPEPETGQLYRINCKCYFLCTVAFGLRFIPVTTFNFPTPNTFLAVNNAQSNECLIHFLV